MCSMLPVLGEGLDHQSCDLEARKAVEAVALSISKHLSLGERRNLPSWKATSRGKNGGRWSENLYLPRLPRLLRLPHQHTPSSFHLNFATVHHRNTYSRLIHFLVPPIHLFPTQRLVTITLLSSCHSILRGSGNAGTLSMTSCTNSSKEWNNCVS